MYIYVILLRTRKLGIYFSIYHTFYDDLELLGDQDVESFRGCLADLGDAAMLFSPRSFNPLLTRHYFTQMPENLSHHPKYCIVVKDQVETQVFTGVSSFIQFYQMNIFQASILEAMQFSRGP